MREGVRRTAYLWPPTHHELQVLPSPASKGLVQLTPQHHVWAQKVRGHDLGHEQGQVPV